MLLSMSIVNVIKSFLRVSLIADIHPSGRSHRQVHSSTILRQPDRSEAVFRISVERQDVVDSFAGQRHGCVWSEQTMQVETKFLQLSQPAALGEEIDGWRVCWLGGWGRHGLFFWVMVAKRKG